MRTIRAVFLSTHQKLSKLCGRVPLTRWSTRRSQPEINCAHLHRDQLDLCWGLLKMMALSLSLCGSLSLSLSFSIVLYLSHSLSHGSLKYKNSHGYLKTKQTKQQRKTKKKFPHGSLKSKSVWSQRDSNKRRRNSPAETYHPRCITDRIAGDRLNHRVVNQTHLAG